MPITCLLSHTYHDLRCPVCGEGFLILAKTSDLNSRLQVRRKVDDALRAEHQAMGALHVHSAEPFTIASDDSSLLEWPASTQPFSARSLSAA